MEAFRKTIYAILSTVITLILVDSPIILIIFATLILSIIEVLVSIRLYQIIASSNVEIFVGTGLYKIIVGSKEIKLNDGGKIENRNYKKEIEGTI